MKRPLVPVALYYAVGLLLGGLVQPPLVLLFTASLLCLILALGRTSDRAWLPALCLVFLGWTNLVRCTAVISPYDLRIQLGNAPVLGTLRGTLAETPSLRVHERDGQELARTLVTLHVSALATNGGWLPAFGQVLVSTRGNLEPPGFSGQEIEVSGVIAPPPDRLAEGLFSYRNYLAHQSIYYQLTTDAAHWKVMNPSAPPPLADRFQAWAKRTLAAGLPEQDEPLRLLWAMTLGWKTALTGEVSEPFMKSGTMHIFAISGLHIALIAGILVSLLRVARLPRRGCGLVVVPLLWFYTAATGWQPSAIRSAIMMSIVVGGWSLSRPSDLLNSLAAAAFIILLWQPQQLFQASFQLSFFVVLSIALLVPPLQRGIDRRLALDSFLAPEIIPQWQRLARTGLRNLLLTLATSLAAWLGALPLTAYYFHICSPVTLLANLVIVPLSALALSCNLGSLLCGAGLPWVSELFNHAAWFWMLGMSRFSRWATLIPGAYAFVPAPGVFTCLIYYGLLVGCLSGWLWQRGRRLRTVAALLLLGLYYGGQWRSARRNFSLTILPLEGGHASFLDAAGRSRDWLVDCGSTNSVVYVVRPFLRAQGVTRLPRLMLTHGDVQHVGGAELLRDEFHCAEVWVSPFRFRSPVYRQVLTRLEHHPGLVKTVHRGDVAPPWRILHPGEDDASSLGDDGALVCQAELHGVRVLLLSDLGRQGQHQLFDREAHRLRSDIVVTGIPTASEALSETLLRAIQPRVIIVADSEFPATARASTKLLDRLTAHRTLVLSTRTSGAVQIYFRPRGCAIATARGESFELAALPAMTLPQPEASPPAAERQW
ncbi:MAG TPA: ComEC/Rec2 family competence protein [Verrucomicrobiota bacterium]|nr:ComEC/Rec2 family competence protein [Verrucomicrobiota bacterium]